MVDLIKLQGIRVEWHTDHEIQNLEDRPELQVARWRKLFNWVCALVGAYWRQPVRQALVVEQKSKLDDYHGMVKEVRQQKRSMTLVGEKPWFILAGYDEWLDLAHHIRTQHRQCTDDPKSRKRHVELRMMTTGTELEILGLQVVYCEWTQGVIVVPKIKNLKIEVL